ncbi:cupin domain-containing protein [Cytophagaceae bacterium DM2B3-1]|uniref:Cupin domain-containing protein n=2 Tax=Xanthocytophaga TaxID=3078918 RepID=A0ABT7CPD4_9BACT|nr:MULTISPECIES: cupin domain-containing protein [Xanthocytophaga]MDJ1468705.1 cupin domain-containing protein [Xanthocytophaga flavus]MDJ1495565.1 cupin domain-containing protein [Xanthocytophaga flavus]MDJ1504057.1 cupin domain-containing protein [Xanthocytophaga agilis]
MSDAIQTNVFIKDQDIAWEVVGQGVKRKVMAYNQDLMMVKVAFETGGVGALHHHYHTQISYVESGAFEITIADEKQVLKKGDVYFIPPDVIHGALCLEEGVLVDVFNPLREDFIK